MAKCKNCRNNTTQTDESSGRMYNWCPIIDDCPDPERERNYKHYKTMTSADWIRSMTNDELAEFLLKFDICPMCSHYTDDFCSTANCNEIGITKKWLQSPVEV